MGSLEDEGVRLLRCAAAGTVRLLELTSGWDVLTVAEGSFHHGDDPIVADEQAHAEFTRLAMQHPAWQLLRIVAIVGEENIVEPPAMTPGQRLIVLDPLDGSRPWALFRMGYCVAALLLVCDAAGCLKVESAIVATPTYTFTLAGADGLFFGRTQAPPDQDIRVESAVPENLVMEPTLACVAYKAADRERAQPMFDRLPDWSIVTLGGNPVTPYVVTGQLTAAITTKPSSTWDAIGILMATSTDAIVGDLEGTIVSGSTFRELYGRVLLSQNVTTIPPMIVAKNLDRYQELKEAAAAL
jgi:hypothetical protein